MKKWFCDFLLRLLIGAFFIAGTQIDNWVISTLVYMCGFFAIEYYAEYYRLNYTDND